MSGVSETVIHSPCILVSACLLGAMCRYDGKSNGLAGLEKLKEAAVLVPFCPEIYGGLPTPREPSEMKDGRVCSKSGRDVTAQFEKGAREALKMAQLLDCRAAILKERSPSCGSHQIYDGTFQGRRIEGQGLTAALLEKNGIRLFDEDQVEECLVWLEEQNLQAEERQKETGQNGKRKIKMAQKTAEEEKTKGVQNNAERSDQSEPKLSRL